MMKDMRNGVCALCDHNEVIETVAADQVDPMDGHVRASRAVYSNRNAKGGFFSNPTKQGFGNIHYFICRSCGFTQTFTTAPHEIPIGEEHLTWLRVGPENEGPYR